MRARGEETSRSLLVIVVGGTLLLLRSILPSFAHPPPHIVVPYITGCACAHGFPNLILPPLPLLNLRLSNPEKPAHEEGVEEVHTVSDYPGGPRDLPVTKVVYSIVVKPT